MFNTDAMISLTDGTQVNWYNLFAGDPWPEVEYEAFENDQTTPLSLEGSWTYVLARDKNATDKIEEGSEGISVTANKMRVKFSGVVPEPGIYYYGLRKDSVAYWGEIYVNHKIATW